MCRQDVGVGELRNYSIPPTKTCFNRMRWMLNTGYGLNMLALGTLTKRLDHFGCHFPVV